MPTRAAEHDGLFGDLLPGRDDPVCKNLSPVTRAYDCKRIKSFARILAEGLAVIKDIELDMNQVQTNMVFLTVKTAKVENLASHLKDAGVLITAANPMRLVTHLDISTEDIRHVVAQFQSYFAL